LEAGLLVNEQFKQRRVLDLKLTLVSLITINWSLKLYAYLTYADRTQELSTHMYNYVGLNYLVFKINFT